MRWLLYALADVVGLVLLAVVVLLAIGGGTGAARLRATTEIDRPATAVFPWLLEPTRLKAWVGWLVEVRSVQPEAAGGRDVWVMEDRNNNNQLMEITIETTHLEAPHRLTSRLSAAEGFDGTVDFTLEEISADRTRLTYTGDFQYHHWLAKLLEPVITRSAQRKLEEDLARLKLQVEAE